MPPRAHASSFDDDDADDENLGALILSVLICVGALMLLCLQPLSAYAKRVTRGSRRDPPPRRFTD